MSTAGSSSSSKRPPGPPPPTTPNLSQLVRPSVRLLVWGRSDMGQLGSQGGDAGGSAPVPMVTEALSGTDVVGCAGGPFHIAWVTADGELYTSGCNDNGQLGRRTAGGGVGSSSFVRPTHVTALESYSVSAAGCGATHTMVLTEQGAVLSWGGNEFGQTGCGGEGPDQHHPRPLRGLGDQRVVRLAVGSNHALLLTGSGCVFAVGQGSFGALGLGDGLLENRSTPGPILPLMPLGVVQVAAGENHSASLTADGRVFTWGRGKYGQLGQGDWDNRPRPGQVAALRGLRAAQVACGGDHTLVVVAGAATATATATAAEAAGAGGGRGGGVLYSFGRGTWGATGLGAVDNTCRPCKVQGLLLENVVQVSAGARHSLALTASHVVYAFGNNDFGQLGLGPGRSATGSRTFGGRDGCGDSFHSSPRRLSSLPPLPVLAVLAAGDSSMVLLQEAAPGALVPAGPHPGRRHGLHLTPYEVPDLMRLATTAATASEDPRVTRDVVVAVEDVLSSPGFVLESFRDPSQPPAPELPLPPSVSPSVSQRKLGGGGAVMPDIPGVNGESKRTAAAAAVPSHGMDVGAIQACFEALLRLYSSDVVAAVGNSLLRLLDALLLQVAAAAPPGMPGGSPLGGSSAGGGSSPTTGPSPSPSPSLRGPSFRSLGAAAPDASSRLAPLRLLFVVYQCPLLAGSSVGLGLGPSLAARLIGVTVRLPAEAQELLYDWLASLASELLGGRVVRPLQHYLGQLAEGGAAGGRAGGGGITAGIKGTSPEQAAARVELLAAARVLAGLHVANEKAGGKLPFTEFHNPKLSAAVNLRFEYVAWLELAGGTASVPPRSISSGAPQPLVSLCQVPALLTPEAKSRILQGEANIQKEAEMNSSARKALLQGLHPATAVFLEISVRRTSLLADAAQQLASRPAHQLKRPLRVTFLSQGVAEEGVDQGGVSREFFQLLVTEIFQPQYGMFTYNEESRTFWFNAAACLDEAGVAEFRLVGVLLGLAIYNGVILDVHFPQAVYKKLLGEPVGLGDLAEAFPTLGRSLKAVLAMEPEQVEGVLCRNLEVQYDYFGEQRTAELTPGGSATPVTGANRDQYVRRLVEWTLGESVDTQFRAFAHGFHQVCGGPAMSLFRHEELELLVCGLPHLDFGALEANARYEGGYHRQHPTIVMFWQVVSELDLDQKRRFLAFTTGCDRAPVAGLGALVLTIQRSGPDSERLPSAHTCFNSLLLPDYSTRARLRSKLLTAFENAQGFGLK